MVTPPAADRIEIRGLRATGVHGVLPHEREQAQPFELDIDVVLDASAAGESDDLGATVDYARVIDAAVGVVTDESHALLERLATRIAQAALDDPRAVEVTVAVRKLRPPVPHDVASTGVRLTRRRD